MACPLCQGDKKTLVYKKIPNLNMCAVCGFVYVSTKYTDKLYNQDYFTKAGPVTGRDFFSEWAVLYDEARFIQEIERIKEFKKGGKVLDIGCATGRFMKMIHQAGFEPYGTDVSSYAVNYIKNTYDFPAFVGFLSEVNFDKKMFDIITMHHVLEHIPNPVEFLHDGVKPILKDNGLLVVEVPNFGSIESKINKAEWEDIKPWEHLNQFTSKTLRFCIEKAGFKEKEVITYTPHTHRLLWHYSQLLSFVLPKSIIVKIGHLLKTSVNEKASKKGNEHFIRSTKKGSYLDDLTRFLAMPLDFLFSKLRLNKYLVMYAEQA